MLFLFSAYRFLSTQFYFFFNANKHICHYCFISELDFLSITFNKPGDIGFLIYCLFFNVCLIFRKRSENFLKIQTSFWIPSEQISKSFWNFDKSKICLLYRNFSWNYFFFCWTTSTKITSWINLFPETYFLIYLNQQKNLNGSEWLKI